MFLPKHPMIRKGRRMADPSAALSKRALDRAFLARPGFSRQVRRRYDMKLGVLLGAVVAFGAMTTHPGFAQLSPSSAKPAARQAATNAHASAGVRPGTVGGPTKKTGGISGTVKRPNH